MSPNSNATEESGMNLVIRAHQIAGATRSSKEYARTKVEKLARHFDGILDARVELTSDKRRLAAEAPKVVLLTVRVNGHILKASESAPGLNEAVDLAVAKMDRQLRRHKEKVKVDSHRRTPLGVALVDGPSAPDKPRRTPRTAPPTGAPAKVVRDRRQQLAPMPVDQAIRQLEQRGHTFFMFLDEDSGSVQVVYRRVTGGYGIREAAV
ncbi:MAG: ribosome hibernation-promoting factor, HPF/YfiA family [Candidatus Dormibacteria bacterium]